MLHLFQRSRRLALLAAGLLGLSPLSAAETIARATPTREAAISPGRVREMQIELALMADPTTFRCPLKVRVFGPKVEVSGEVSSDKAKNRALQIAFDVANIPVHDNIKIAVLEGLTNPVVPGEQVMRDASRALSEVLGKASQMIDISVRGDGRVTLKGTVETHGERHAVSARLRHVAGCAYVHNLLELAPRSRSGNTAPSRMAPADEGANPTPMPKVTAPAPKTGASPYQSTPAPVMPKATALPASGVQRVSATTSPFGNAPGTIQQAHAVSSPGPIATSTASRHVAATSTASPYGNLPVASRTRTSTSPYSAQSRPQQVMQVTERAEASYPKAEKLTPVDDPSAIWKPPAGATKPEVVRESKVETAKPSPELMSSPSKVVKVETVKPKVVENLLPLTPLPKVKNHAIAEAVPTEPVFVSPAKSLSGVSAHRTAPRGTPEPKRPLSVSGPIEAPAPLPVPVPQKEVSHFPVAEKWTPVVKEPIALPKPLPAPEVITKVAAPTPIPSPKKETVTLTKTEKSSPVIEPKVMFPQAEKWTPVIETSATLPKVVEPSPKPIIIAESVKEVEPIPSPDSRRLLDRIVRRERQMPTSNTVGIPDRPYVTNGMIVLHEDNPPADEIKSVPMKPTVRDEIKPVHVKATALSLSLELVRGKVIRAGGVAVLDAEVREKADGGMSIKVRVKDTASVETVMARIRQIDEMRTPNVDLSFQVGR